MIYCFCSLTVNFDQRGNTRLNFYYLSGSPSGSPNANTFHRRSVTERLVTSWHKTQKRSSRNIHLLDTTSLIFSHEHIGLCKMHFLSKLNSHLCQSRDTQLSAVSLKGPLFSPGLHRFHQILSDDAEVLQYGFDVGEGVDRLAAHLHLPSRHLRCLQWWRRESEPWCLQQPLLKLAAKRSHRMRTSRDQCLKWDLLRCRLGIQFSFNISVHFFSPPDCSGLTPHN